jgi:hypothetical protein
MDYIKPSEDGDRLMIYESEFVAAGFSPEEAKLAVDHVREKVNTVVSQSLIRPVSPDMPNWMSNPYLAPIAALKQFIFGFNATVGARFIHEARNGNYTPAFYAASFVPAMIAIDYIRDMMTEFGEEPEWKRNWSMADHAWYGVERSGLAGRSQFFSDYKGDVGRGGVGVESALGPAAGQVAKALRIDDSSDLFRWVVKALPINSVYDGWVL